MSFFENRCNLFSVLLHSLTSVLKYCKVLFLFLNIKRFVTFFRLFFTFAYVSTVLKMILKLLSMRLMIVVVLGVRVC